MRRAPPIERNTMSDELNPRPARRALAIRLFGRDLAWYWTLLILIAVLVAVHLMIRLQVRDATREFLDGFSWFGQGTFEQSGYDFGGRVESTGLAIQPAGAEDGAAIRIARVRVQTPGLVWLLRSQLPSRGGAHFPPTQQLRFVFESVDWGKRGMQRLLPDLGWIGPYSGAAFEAAGCTRDLWWHRDGFADRFGLAAPAGNVSMVFRVEAGLLQQTVEFGTPETSLAIIERRFALPVPEKFLDTPSSAWRTVDVRWSFRDHGFNKARNRYCAKQAGISEGEFIDRHVAAVERILAAEGLVFPRTMWLAYRRYAEGGRELTWQSDFADGVALEDLQQRRGAALYKALNASVRVEGFPRVPYQPELIEPRPLSDRGDVPVYAAMQREQGVTAPAAAAAEPSLAEVLSDGASADTAVAAPVPAAPLQTSDLVDAPLPEAQPVAVVAPASAPPATAAPASTSSPPARAAVASAPPTSTSTSTPVPSTAAPAANEPAALPPGSQIASRDLGRHIGVFVRVELSNGRSYVGAVARNDAEAVTLNVRMRSGNASLTLPHRQIRRVTVRQ
jgi:hypothetical protein